MKQSAQERRRPRAIALAVSLAIPISGCSTMASIPQDHFAKHKRGLTDEGVCAAMFTAAAEYKSTGRTAYFTETLAEVERRGRSVDWCNKRRDEQQNAAAGAVALVAVVGLVALAAKGGRGGAGNGYAPASSASDTNWDWDQFFDANGQLVWRCRGVQTGQFAIDVECINKPQLDLRWPGPSFVAGGGKR